MPRVATARSTLGAQLRRARVLLEPAIDPEPDFLGHAGPVDRRVVRYGSCEFRSMDRAHSFANPVGYPLVAVDELKRRHGVAVGWQNVFVLDFETLPTDRDGLLQHYRLDGAPDVVVIGVGAVYAAYHLLGLQDVKMNLRDQLGLRANDLALAATYRVHEVVLPRVGRRARQYAGCAGVRSFVELLHCCWPQATVVIELPLDAVVESSFRSRDTQRVRQDLSELIAQLGLDVVDHAELLAGDRGLRCRNGYNLNTRGSEVVGGHWADQLARRWALTPA